MWSWNDFVTKGIKKVQKTVDNFAGSVPLVPVAWYDSKTWQKTTHYISAWGALWLWDNKGMLSSGVDVLSRKIDKRVYEQAADLERAFWWDASLDWTSIKRAWVGKNWKNALLAYKEEINKYKTEKWSGLTLNTNNEWRKLFEDWLDELKDKDPEAKTFDKDRTVWQWMIKYWEQDGHTLEWMFDGNKERIRAYANFFELGDVKDWVTLKKMDISKK